jgi:hypothetical protein
MGRRVSADPETIGRRKRRRTRAKTPPQPEQQREPDQARRRRGVVATLVQEREKAPKGRYAVVLDLPRAVELLFTDRDETGRRRMHHAAVSLYMLYLDDAEPPTVEGTRRVAKRTRRAYGRALGFCARYVRMLDAELRAAGVVLDGGRWDAGDGQRSYVVKRGPNKGARRIVTKKRRVSWIVPAGDSVVDRVVDAVTLSPDCKVGNLLPPVFSPTVALDPSSSGASCFDPAASDLPSQLSNGAPLRDQHQPPDQSPPFSPVSAVSGSSSNRSVGVAVAPPIDRITVEDHPPLEIITAVRETERPTAAPRGGGASLDPPSVIGATVVELSAVPAGCVPPPDPLTVRHQTGGSPPPVTPDSLLPQHTPPTVNGPSLPVAPPPIAGAWIEQSATEKPPAVSPDSAFEKAPTTPRRLEPQPRRPAAAPPARRPLRPGAGVAKRPAARAERTAGLPERVPNHSADCSCSRCWIADRVADGAISDPPHRMGCGCPVCGAWRALALLQWKRFRNPEEAARQDAAKAAAEEAAERDPTVQLMRRLHTADLAGQLAPGEREGLIGLIFEGRLDELAARLELAETQKAGGG